MSLNTLNLTNASNTLINIVSTIKGTSDNWNSVYTTVNAGSAFNIIAGGNSRGANITIGTNDAYHFRIETNNNAKFTILSSGEVGIGTTLAETGAAGSGGVIIKNNLLVKNDATVTGLISSNNIKSNDTSIGFGLSSSAVSLYNTAIGINALEQNIIGNGNVALGYSALQNLTAGDINVAIGINSLVNCVTGVGNIAIGANSCLFSDGYNNVAVGVDTLRGTASQGIIGGDNTAIGSGALSSVNGGSNTALGFRAGESLPSGNSNIFIGVVSNATVPVTGSIAIGRNATVTESNQLVLGSSSFPLTGNSIMYGGLTFTKSISSGENILSNQVAFSVNNNDAAAPFNAGSTITYSVQNVNRGNALNLGTGIFTAPVAGVYFINFSGITESGGSGPPHRVFLLKNGVVYPSIQAFSDAAGYNSMSFSLALPLNASDALSIYVDLGRIHGNNGSCFSGYLIG